VELRVSRIDAPDATATDPETRCTLRFEVIDQGPGIPAERQAEAFQPFVRLDAQRHQPGVGLGLTIAASLVASMGGQLNLASEAGQGCHFSFELTLPVVGTQPGEPDANPDRSHSTSAASPQGAIEGASDADPVLPQPEALAPLQPMLELGQMVGMARWLEDFGKSQPSFKPFVDHAVRLCLMADLPALERWLAKAGLHRGDDGVGVPSTPELPDRGWAYRER
jgi:hypothetical protein